MTPDSSHRFVHGGLTLLVRRWGARQVAGSSTYVLVHGIGVSSRYFTRLAALLSRSGTVFAVDLPGFGGAPRPERELSVEAGADLLSAFLGAEGIDSAVLVGHSMGSQFTVEATLRTPDRVAGLVLIGAVVDERARAPWQQGMRLARDVLRESPTANWIVGTDYLRSGLRWYLTELPVMLGYRIEQRIRSVSVPVLVLRGERDPIAPHGWSAALVARAVDGRLVTVPGAAHVVQHTAAVSVAGILAEFEAELTASAPARVPGARTQDPPARQDQ